MYICVFIFIYLVFYSNLINFFFFFLLIYLAIYFLNLKNLFNIYEYNLLIEDRIVILLENIMRIEYNLELLLLFFFFLLFWLKKYSSFYFILLYFILFYLENFLPFQTFNFIFFTNFKLNTKLLNGLFLIHPYCIYMFYSLIFFFIVVLAKNKIKLYNLNYSSYYFYFYKLNHSIQLLTLYFGIISITLGSWWAYQEINWNSWWSWDLVEIINFVLIFIILLFLHSNTYEYSFKRYNYILYLVFYIIISFLILSRYNLINSLHSFIVLNNFEQFSHYFFFFFIFFYFFLLKYRNFDFLVISKKLTSLNSINIFKLFFSFIVIIFLYKIYYEIGLFILNFESKLEYLYFYKNINIVAFFSIFLIYINLNIKLFFFLFFFSYFELLLAIVFLYNIYKNQGNFYKVHLFIFLFLLINSYSLYLVNYSLKLWNYNFINYIENCKVNFYYYKKNIYFVNNFVNNLYVSKINFFYIDAITDNFLNYSKNTIFFLSNFFFYFNNIFIFNYKFFYFYFLILFEFFSYYVCLAFLIYLLFILKKKISKTYYYYC